MDDVDDIIQIKTGNRMRLNKIKTEIHNQYNSIQC